MNHSNQITQASMKGVWLENGTLKVRTDMDIPSPHPDEALIKIRKAGICATDLAMVKGYYPFTGILGHEFVGEVVMCQNHPEWMGKRVVGEINIPCGACAHCNNERERHCSMRQVIGIKQHHGAFAQYMTLPVRNLYSLPKYITDESAIFIEPLAAALRILSQVPIGRKTSVLVSGAGRLGQLIAQVMASTGCRLIVSAKYQRQRDILNSLGICTIAPGNIEKKVSKDKKFDVVIEATGSPTGFASGREWVRPEGIFVLKSTFKGDVTLNLSSVVVDEMTLIGSRCGPFSPAIEFLEAKKSKPEILIDSVHSLDDVVEAFKKAKEPEVLKVIIGMND